MKPVVAVIPGAVSLGAVILGAVVLGEHLRPEEYLGMAAVICAVALVTSSQMKSGRPAAGIEAAPVEHEA